MKNLWMMLYGLAHIGQGVALLVSLGSWNPDLAQRASMGYARWSIRNP